MPENQVIVVGKIVKPHGIKGELVVEPLTDFPAERFKPGNVVETVDSAEFPSLTVRAVRPHKDRLLLVTEEINDRNKAEQVRDVELGVRPDEVIFPGEDEYYGFQLLGLEVFDKSGEKIGVIRDIAGGEANDNLVIEHPELGLIDYPAVDSLIERVEIDNKKIFLDLPRGWQLLARDGREET